MKHQPFPNNTALRNNAAKPHPNRPLQHSISLQTPQPKGGDSTRKPPQKQRLCLSLWLIQDSNWKGRALWRLSGGLATILQNWISCNEQKMREAHITRRETSFYLFMIFIEKISNRKLKHSQIYYQTVPQKMANAFFPEVPREQPIKCHSHGFRQ